jgi:hypothetical protein
MMYGEFFSLRFVEIMPRNTFNFTKGKTGFWISYVGTEKRREKVVVLRELQRVIIYTRELSKQAIEGHVSTAFIGYSVNEGARLT